MDAFEIGIRLALDDEVSAGLELINRDLAAIDKAIASVNAGLLRLNQASLPAETVAGPSGAAQTRKEAPVPTATLPLLEERAPATGAPMPQAPESAAAAPAARAISGREESRVEPQATMQRREIVNEVPERLPVAGSAPEAVEPRTVAREVSTAPSVPEAERKSEKAIAPTPPSALDVAVPLVPAPPSGPEERPAASPQQKPSASGSAQEPAKRSSVTALMTQIKLQQASQSERHVERHFEVESMRYDNATAKAHRIAGESGGAHSETRTGTDQGRGGSVAPTYDAREESSSLRGTIVLDGRLVGHWMSDQFAQDASRPPSGPTFFDPRQGPAWTSSGAL